MVRLLSIIAAFLLVVSTGYSKGLKPYMFTLKDEYGNTVSLEQLKGKVVFLVFWSKTCGKCRVELRKLNNLYKKYRDKGVVFYAIIIDEKNIKKLKEIKQSWGFEMPILIGNSTVRSKYRIVGTPITYILRKNLTVGKIIFGSYSPEKAEKVLKKLLKEN